MQRLIIAITFIVFWLQLTFSQSIGTFISVMPTAQSENLVLPATHSFQRISYSSETLLDGTIMRNLCDFTGFVSIAGSSTTGYLSINHETIPFGGVSIFQMNYNNIKKRWDFYYQDSVDFSPVVKTRKNCSGGITPWGTVITAEEFPDDVDTDGDGYPDSGWLVEINPASATVVDHDYDGNPDKLWSMGYMSHENVTIANDTTYYYGCDDPSYGYIYKYISNVPKNPGAGKCYVLVADSVTDTIAHWRQVPNSTNWEQRKIQWFADTLGAVNFDGVEDVEFGPDSKIYFTAKALGRIYRCTPLNDTTVKLEIYVENTSYQITYNGGTLNEDWGIGNDNLAFDAEDNLWVLQDGSRNHIWVVRPGHTTSNPKIDLFATTPLGCEPTGITFTPDGKFIFMTIMHPAPSNTDVQIDAMCNKVIFNQSTVLVISRRENLGIWNETGFLSVFPSPSSGDINVSIAAANHTIAPFTITDMEGKKVQSGYFELQLGMNTKPVDMKFEKSGIYIITVTISGNIYSEKFTIE